MGLGSSVTMILQTEFVGKYEFNKLLIDQFLWVYITYNIAMNLSNVCRYQNIELHLRLEQRREMCVRCGVSHIWLIESEETLRRAALNGYQFMSILLQYRCDILLLKTLDLIYKLLKTNLLMSFTNNILKRFNY